MRRVVKIADIDIEVRVDDDELLGPVDVLLSGCDRGADPRIVLHRHARPIEAPVEPPSTWNDQATYWFLESGVVARHDSGVCGRRRGDVVEIGGVAVDDDPVTAFRLAMQMPLCDALAQHGREVIHAAAIERDGVGVLVTGTSGAGKSTFAFAAASRGWTVLTDDLTLVRADGGIDAWGFPKPLHVPADVLDHPPAGATVITDDARERWSLAPPMAERSTTLRYVVAVGRSDVEAMTDDGEEGVPWVKELLYSFPFIRVPSRLRSMFPVAAAISRLPSVRYLHDRDPAERVGAVADFLDRLGAEPTGDVQ